MTNRDAKKNAETAREAADKVFRSVDPEVWVVTSGTAERRGGLLATWVQQVSLSPERPVLLLGLAPNHHTATLVDETGAAAAHLLRLDQSALGLNFADGSGRERDKFAGWDVDQEASQQAANPILAGCYGWVAGTVFARLDAGDRIFYWLRILEAEHAGGNGPLRQSQLMGQATNEQKQRLRADRESDSLLQAPWQRAWADAVARGEATVRWPVPQGEA